MKTGGLVAIALGTLLLFVAFAYDTAPEGTHNIGLLQAQMMLFSLGCLLVLCGSVAASVGYAIQRMERAGLLPSTGYRAQQPTSSSATCR